MNHTGHLFRRNKIIKPLLAFTVFLVIFTVYLRKRTGHFCVISKGTKHLLDEHLLSCKEPYINFMESLKVLNTYCPLLTF